MPEILNVPHFRGVRIHKGNSAADTDACILVGTWNGTTDNWIASSKIAYDKLYALLKNARDNKEEITITISNV
jgi:hypothetical protein